MSKSTLEKLTREISRRTYGMALPLEAADIAQEAITYAIKPWLEGTGDFPSDEKHLMCTARKVARWEIADAVKKASRMPECTSLDDTAEDEDGSVREHSAAEVEYALQHHYASKRRNEWLDQGRTALRRLDGFLSGNGFSRRDIEIYKARDLLRAPTDLVCAKYSISPSNLYKIVCIIKGILSRGGRDLVQD